MANNCSVSIKIDKLPAVINKVEYFMFRAMEQAGVNYFQLAKNPGQYVAGLFPIAKNLIQEKATEYKDKSKTALEDNLTDLADDYATYAANLENILANWVDVFTNTLVYSSVFSVKTRFKLDEDGMVDLSRVADDEDGIYKKFIVDQSANEVDPFDTIDKAVEMFIRSIPKQDMVPDEYGFTTSVDYGSFTRNLMADLEGTISIDEIIERLKSKLDKTPEYQTIIDMLEFKPDDNTLDIQLKINFRNSFAKAEIPIYMTSIEGDVVKVFEATTARRSKYEQTLKSNFALRGAPVTINGNTINLAHQEDGMWVMTSEDVQKIKDFLDREKVPAGEMANRKIEFLKALGFTFSPKTEELLRKGFVNRPSFDYIYNHLINRLSNPSNNKKYGPVGKTDVIIDPVSSLKKDWNKFRTGQNNIINDLIETEIKYNPAFNVERSVINPEGNRQHSTQLHNNFTILNKYFSDYKSFPTLQSILDAEPSLSWLNPETNVGIRDSIYLNSLFYTDPTSEFYGMRKRVYTDKNGQYKFSPTQGAYVELSVINTGGVQLKDDGSLKVDGSSTTGLNEVDKLLQDLNTFMKGGFSSVSRLSDKSTDLAIMSNFYADPLTGEPFKRPLGSLQYGSYANIFTTPTFVKAIANALKDIVRTKYLATKGFYKDLDFASKNALDTYGELDKIMKINDLDKMLDSLIKDVTSVEQAEALVDDQDVMTILSSNVGEYFKGYSAEYKAKMAPVVRMVDTKFLFKAGDKDSTSNLSDVINYYLASTFLVDLENMKMFFGSAIHFKDFTKRASKDSATGIFTFVEPKLLETLNDRENPQGYGVNTNLSARMLAERLFTQGKITREQRDQIIAKQEVTKEFKSALIADVNFNSKQSDLIIKNVEKLYKAGNVSEAAYKLFKENISKVIQSKYEGKEADGQGKVTFDFYRIMSILTNSWDANQERVYKKIVEYSHFDELAEAETDETKKAEYLAKRDAVGYDPTEQVYFPVKKFQYSGPIKHEMMIDGELYNSYVPGFDKFSLQPLIPTLIKGTEDEDLAKRMEIEGIAYVKFKSASKTETPKAQDELYEGYDENNPEVRTIKTFDKRLSDGTLKFTSEHTQFMTHLKEQVRIEAEAHDDVIFGSQARKLILMNLLSLNTDHNREEFLRLYDQYKGLISDLIQIEKTLIYNKLGIVKKSDGSLAIGDVNKLVKYFSEEIAKKNQDSNVRKALQLDDKGNFKIPLDAAVQAQVIEGIVISSINNNIVRYKTSGSMLTQVAITGSAAKKYSKDASQDALETFGNTELKYYDVKTVDGKNTVTAMQVKVGFTEQWQPLLRLKHKDGAVIGSLPRLNEMLKDEAWMDENRKSVRMIAYRIPTQGRNFMDVMEVAEFLPAQFGDAIIMPSEAIIKSGSDFDIDKMFTFYPNLRSDGSYNDTAYTEADLRIPDADYFRPAIQNKLYETMAEIILHPNNYMELVTPSDNYHIEPIVNQIYEALGLKSKGAKRPTTDYKNTDILNRARNIEKFLSLLNGKADLGIAAVANTFNVLFQIANARSNPDFFSKTGMKTFFNSPTIKKTKTNDLEEIFYGDIYDEDGMLKSEFFSEFINAFVDVAKDDYVFAVNVVTEFSPMIFYMKFAGLSSEKILPFVNQPILRVYIKNLSKYNNMFVKNFIDNEATDVEKQLLQYTDEERLSDENALVLADKLAVLRSNARAKALKDTLKQFQFEVDSTSTPEIKRDIRSILSDTDYSDSFDGLSLLKSIKPAGSGVSTMSQQEKNVQLAVLYEMLNLKEQSDSMTNAQRFLNFDTNPYASAFDVYVRNVSYQKAISSDPKAYEPNVLSKQTLASIKRESVIAPLDVATEIVSLLETLMPVRNNRAFNKNILERVIAMRASSNRNIQSQDDMLRYARTVKNDYMNFILQNYFDKSSAGKEFMKAEFGTDKSLNEYLKELIETDKMRKQLVAIRSRPDYDLLVEQFPILNSIVIEPGTNTRNLIAYKFIQNSSNPVEKQSMILQFADIASLESAEVQDVRDFARNLALYSVFQSGYNTSDISYTGITPVELINNLYAIGVKQFESDFEKLTPDEKSSQYKKFFTMFSMNNPGFYSTKKPTDTITGESSKRGKWYTDLVSLSLKRKEVKQPKVENKMTENAQEITMQSYNVEKIKSGVKTLTSRNYMVKDGVYKLVNKDNNNIFVELKFYKQISILDLDTPEKKDSYAKKEGFDNWLDLEYKVTMGLTKTLTKEFLDGAQKVYVYRIKNVTPGIKTEEIKAPQLVEQDKPGPAAVRIFKFNRQSAEIGTTADQAMRKIATSSIVEFKTDKVKSSSLTTFSTVGEENSYEYSKDRYVGVSYTGLKNNRVNFGTIVMLARNGKLTGTPLSADTISEINEAHRQGAKFVVGDMPGVDTPFIDHLNSIGAVYAIYGHGRLKGVSDVEKSAAKTVNNNPTQTPVDNNSKIDAFRESLVWTLDMSNGEIEEMYNKEKLSGETIEEFLQRMSCLGKLK